MTSMLSTSRIGARAERHGTSLMRRFSTRSSAPGASDARRAKRRQRQAGAFGRLSADWGRGAQRSLVVARLGARGPAGVLLGVGLGGFVEQRLHLGRIRARSGR